MILGIAVNPTTHQVGLPTFADESPNTVQTTPRRKILKTKHEIPRDPTPPKHTHASRTGTFASAAKSIVMWDPLKKLRKVPLVRTNIAAESKRGTTGSTCHYAGSLRRPGKGLPGGSGS